MATMNVSLPDGMKAWVEEQARSDRYGNSSDYVRDLIRKDQERERAIAEMQALIQEGLDSGPAVEMDMETFLAERHAAHAKRR